MIFGNANPLSRATVAALDSVYDASVGLFLKSAAATPPV